MGAETKAGWAARCSTRVGCSTSIRAGPILTSSRVIVRADRRVRQLHFESEKGERCDMLLPTVDDTDLGVSFFACLLPWETRIVSLQGLRTPDME